MTDDRQARDEHGEKGREDLYREWLGIATPSPTHYELLGVPALESDAETILRGARQVKRRLRTYQIGRYRKGALELLTDVGQAVSVLTNRERRQFYNNELLGQWKALVEELYREHGQGRDPLALETWLAACRERGVPISRLLPALVRSLRGRGERWPSRGEHGLGLPEGLWIYRDAVILGNCLRGVDLERRADAVKRVQKALGVPEGLARLVAEEVARGPDTFARLPLVREAERRPGGAVLRLGRRMRRLGGHVDRRSKVLSAVATLVGMGRHDLHKILPHLDARPFVLPIGKRVVRVVKRVRQDGREGVRRTGAWFSRRPHLLIGAAVVVGLVALVLAILVVTGVWRPQEKASRSEEPPPFGSMQRPAEPEAGEKSGDASPGEIEAWREFIRKYPVEEPSDEENRGEESPPTSGQDGASGGRPPDG